SGTYPTLRHALFEELWTLMRPLTHSARERLMRRLRAWHIMPERRARARARPLAGEEIRKLGAAPLIEIGAHTLTHPLLAALPLEEQWREIEASKRRLQSILRAPVDSFAYPYGGRDAFTRETQALVKEAGFALACSTRSARVKRRGNILALPRLAVGNWSARAFRRWLEAWAD
ncbi:MAG TPA: polysaccharide deacetylase family protein, partial [Longimicrobiales bacterium]